MKTSTLVSLCGGICRRITLAASIAAFCLLMSPQTIVAQNITSPATSPDNDDVVTLDEFQVTTRTDDSYLSTQSTSGTRLKTDIINLPFSMTILTEDFVTDFQLFDLDEQAVFVSGMAAGDPATGGGGGTRLRGFFVPYFRNGFYRTQAPDSNSIARVEVVKGPQSAIYGRVSPGGVINYISKKPSTKPQAGVSQMMGTYHNERTTAYASGPLVKDKLFARIDATYYQLERPSDFWYNRTTNISGGMVYKPARGTSISLEHEYTKRVMEGAQAFARWQETVPTQVLDANDNLSTQNITYTRGSVYDMPDRVLADRLAKFLPNGAHSRINRVSNSTYLGLEQRLGQTASLRINAGYSKRDHDRHGTSTPTTWTMDPAGANLTALNSLNSTLSGNKPEDAGYYWLDVTRGIWTSDRAGAHEVNKYVEKGVQADVTKQWNGRVVKQRTLVTFDIFSQRYDRKTWALSGAALNNALAAIGYKTTAQQNAWKRPDPFNPYVSGYLEIPAFDATWAATESATWVKDQIFYGGLASHTADFFKERLSLVGSVRYDWAEYRIKRPLQTAPGSKLKDASDSTRQFTYSFGVNGHILPRKLVAYASVASGFNPDPQTDPNTGEMFGNRESVGVEGGIKGLLLGDILSYSAAIFSVKQDNEVTDDPNNPGGADPSRPRYIGGSSTRGRGMSFDVGGKITSNLTLLGNISWTDIEIVKNLQNPNLVGTRPTGGQNVPPRSYALAGRYNFRDGHLKGLRLGLSYMNVQAYERFVPVYHSTYRLASTGERLRSSVTYITEKRVEWSGFIGYNIKLKNKTSFDVVLNVLNILDDKKMTVAGYYPLGREIRLTMSLKY